MSSLVKPPDPQPTPLFVPIHLACGLVAGDWLLSPGIDSALIFIPRGSSALVTVAKVTVVFICCQNHFHLKVHPLCVSFFSPLFFPLRVNNNVITSDNKWAILSVLKHSLNFVQAPPPPNPYTHPHLHPLPQDFHTPTSYFTLWTAGNTSNNSFTSAGSIKVCCCCCSYFPAGLLSELRSPQACSVPWPASEACELPLKAATFSDNSVASPA